MEYNVDLKYPVCKKCKEGVLLPFFWKDMGVVYFCSNCGVKFTALAQEPTENGKPVFLDSPVYVDVPKDDVPTDVDTPETETAEEEDIDDIFDIPEKDDKTGDLQIGWETDSGVLDAEGQTAAEPHGATIEEVLDETKGPGEVEDIAPEEPSGKNKKKRKKRKKSEPKEEDEEAPSDIDAYDNILSKYIDEDK